MATISDINTGSSYRGEAALGGRGAVGVTIDPSPLNRLATFTYYSDRDKWEKKNQEDKAAAEKIASLTAFDITSPLKPFADDLKSSLQKIQSFVRDNPDSLVWTRNPKLYQQREEMINEFLNKRKGATISDTLYNAEKSRVEKLPAGPARDAGLALLKLNADDLFKEGLETAYNTQIRVSPELKPDDYKLPAIPDTEVFTITRNANDTVIEGKSYADIDRLDALADGTYFRLSEGRLNEDSEDFKRLSPTEQNRQRLEATATNKKILALDSTARTIDQLVQSFKATKLNAQGQPISIEDVPDSEIVKSGGSIAKYIKSVKEYNSEVDKLNAATGKTYGHINLDDGATPQELLKLEFFNNNGGTLFKELKPTVQQTDNAIQLEKIRADKALGWAGLNWDKDKFKLQTQGSEQVKNGATLFAERMYNELKSLADKNGVIAPDKLRRLTTEQLKYLGYDKEEVDASGKVIKGLKPLAIIPDDASGEQKKVDAIQLINGEIRVLSDAKKIPNSNSWEGLWDQTRSTTVSNIATNRLNEQLSKAGSKELNSYLPLDAGNIEVQSTTSGGGTTMSGSSSTGGRGYNVVDPKTGKVVMTVKTQEEANKASAKGYLIQ